MVKLEKETLDVIKSNLEELSKNSENSDFSHLEELKLQVFREKCIYENFDCMRLRDDIFHAKLWVPKEKETQFKKTLDRLSKKPNFGPPNVEQIDLSHVTAMPPTYYITNDVTAPFLLIVETYGIARYREINPGLFTMSTFPYQFGVMFGDIGHGGLLFAFGSFLVYKYDELKASKAVPKGVLDLRYLLFLMGMMAFYCGFTYNEIFAITLKLFGQCHEEDTLERIEGCNYPIGMDPMWYQAKNEVAYFNSFKMKLSIIIGVLHMSMGIVLKGWNNINFGLWIDFFFEFIPQLVFLTFTFGYMCAAIVIKWCKNWSEVQPPSILVIYTGMGVATPGNVLWGDEEGLQQTAFQQTIFCNTFV